MTLKKTSTKSNKAIKHKPKRLSLGEIRGAVGFGGAGKTTLLRYLRSLGYPGQILTFNPTREPSHGTCVKRAGQVFSLWGKGPITLESKPGDGADEIDAFCKGLLTLPSNLSPSLLVLDQCDTYMSASYCPKYLKIVVDSGRPLGIGILWGCRRLGQVHTSLKGSTKSLYIFRTHENNAVKDIRGLTDAPEQVIRNIPDHCCLEFREGSGTTAHGRCPNRKAKNG